MLRADLQAGDLVLVKGCDFAALAKAGVAPDAVCTAEVLSSTAAGARCKVAGVSDMLLLPPGHQAASLCVRPERVRRHDKIVVGQWVRERVSAFDSNSGQRWSHVNYGALADKATILCYICAVHEHISYLYTPDDGEALKITNENVRRRRVSSICEVKVSKSERRLSTETKNSVPRQPPPASLAEVPWLNPLARDKGNVLQCIQSILRSRGKREKPTDSRDIHMSFSSFEGITRSEYVGTLSAIRVCYPLRESFDAEYMHVYGSCPVEHMQICSWRTKDELERLGNWFGQPNFNMHRRGNRPKLCVPMPVMFDEMNVVHPKYSRTRIVTVAYQRVGPVAQGTAHHFLPGGDCAPPAMPVPTQPSEPVQCGEEEYTDAVLQGEQIEIDSGTYKIIEVGPTCKVTLVAGSGTQSILIPRADAVRRLALFLGLAPPQ
ncbi:hypothetical protein AURANDRAFT_68102 [Aureococcus anophagefferens]|uniref:Uncharacterized protein n=1 Tax=Aureococcus anophagefferens TaxID=44056 RepID=F0YNH8_AURAN|nr:hypothetical protein AURANDRAFT_68102 [Aureococcus anophagefferens]EGB03321.1 hypothetical protein AURANDRAFT_68102 [Aureococcus anophagefferens]|eukprot:XP_009041967.1 hypothetical protein AURANDRAFT_68102 [Aureococcus anophagefferens]